MSNEVVLFAFSCVCDSIAHEKIDTLELENALANEVTRF